jgi:iron complex transport system substrate-binding protein
MVGVSHQCDYPAEASNLPTLTGTWIIDKGDSRPIAERVQANKDRWGTIYDVDEDLLAELKPDIILTQQVCKVCAVPADAALEVAARKLKNCVVIPFTANRLQDILTSIRLLADAAGIPKEGERLATEIAETVFSVRERASQLEPKRSFVMEWIEPLKNAGHWIPELVEAAGGREELGNWDGKTSASWEQVLDFSPEVLLISPCGFDIPRTLQEMNKAASRPGWCGLPAVKNKAVFLGNGKVITRYAPRIKVVVQSLAHILHPELFPQLPDPTLISPLFRINSGVFK